MTTWQVENVVENLLKYAKESSFSFFKTILGDDITSWKVRELVEGVGNMNFIYFLEGGSGSVVVKWAPPYVRCVGESWKMDPIRGKFEAKFLEFGNEKTPGYVPKLFHFDPERYLIFMENLQGFENLKYGLIKGVKYPSFGEHISSFLVDFLFSTSDIALKLDEKMKLVSMFAQNGELCTLTQSVMFLEPYIVGHPNNTWTEGLDSIVNEIQTDSRLKLASVKLLSKFRNSTEALIHADLHTASIMTTQDRTSVIDGEFCFFGPMGFDLGKLTASLFINYFAQRGLGNKEMEQWILDTIKEIWSKFNEKFIHRWNENTQGDLYIKEFIQDKDLFATIQADYLKNVYKDALGFAGISLIRRVIGIASNPDMLAIKDLKVRAECETRQLKLGRQLLLGIGSIQEALRYSENTW